MKIISFFERSFLGFVFLSFYPLSVLTGCLTVGKETCPYRIVFDEAELTSDNAKISFKFENCSGKEIDSFLVSVTFFDEEGEPALFLEQVSFPIERTVLPGEKCECVIDMGNSSFDNYESGNSELEEVPVFSKGIHIEKIEYSDGSVWLDYLGCF